MTEGIGVVHANLPADGFLDVRVCRKRGFPVCIAPQLGASSATNRTRRMHAQWNMEAMGLGATMLLDTSIGSRHLIAGDGKRRGAAVEDDGPSRVSEIDSGGHDEHRTPREAICFFGETLCARCVVAEGKVSNRTNG